MTTQRNSGPNRMRLWADYIEQNVKHHLLPLAVKNPDTLRELAAQWEADRAALERLTAAASGRGMVSEMDGLPEIAVLVTGLHERAERAEAALADKKKVCDGLVAAIENNQEIDEEHCRELDAARAALEQVQDALSVRDHQYLAAKAQLVALRAALEQARALLKRIEWQDATTRPIFCDIVVCVACGRDHPNHYPTCDLAALLAAAKGGAA